MQSASGTGGILDTTTEAMWKGDPDRVQRARNKARSAGNRGDFSSEHSQMLSAYISAWAEHPVWYGIMSIWHASIMLWCWKKLSHNQLDVLIQFLLKTRSGIRLIRRGRLRTVTNLRQPRSLLLLRLANREMGLVEGNEVKPHQKALAIMTYTEVMHAVGGFWRNDIVNCIGSAMELEKEIRQEADRKQALAQFSRVLRKAGEIYMSPEMKNFGTARLYLKRAEVMAEKVGANDQVWKIRALLKIIEG